MWLSCLYLPSTEHVVHKVHLLTWDYVAGAPYSFWQIAGWGAAGNYRLVYLRAGVAWFQLHVLRMILNPPLYIMCYMLSQLLLYNKSVCVLVCLVLNELPCMGNSLNCELVRPKKSYLCMVNAIRTVMIRYLYSHTSSLALCRPQIERHFSVLRTF